MAAPNIPVILRKYLSSYSLDIQNQVNKMVSEETLGTFLLNKYPQKHNINNDKMLREYVMELKNRHLRKSSPLSKIVYDKKIHIINHALGLHTFVSRVQGNKLKSKNEIRVSHLFKDAPEPFLEMIVVHELAHLRIKAHDKAFYQLCEHMLPSYHQLEFEMRLYLVLLDIKGKSHLL